MWVVSLGLVPLLALGGAFVVVRARHGGPVSTPSDLAVWFLEYWGAVAAWFYIVFVILVALGVWVQPSPD